MGRAPCCDKANVKKGPWSPEEDLQLKEYIEKHGTGGNWIALPQKAGLRRCGKSCRLRWLNYLRPNIKHGEFSDDEDRIICTLFASIGSRWSIIAAQLPGRTDNDIKNYWNTKLKKKLMALMPPISQRKTQQLQATFSSLLHHSSPALSSSPPSYKCSSNINTTYYNPAARSSFTGLEPTISVPSSSLVNRTTTTATATTGLPHQESFVGPMHHYQVKDGFLMFGGETSCSSSDGSCSNQNQLTHAKDIDYEYGGSNCTEQMGFQNYFYNGVEENHKFMLSNGGGGGGNGWTEKPNGVWGETPIVDYGLEEIKQLISTNSCNNFLVDENKTEERVMMYY
ncbi:hypothetical protein L1049_007766 [Liquidambar formosana]|uniref:Uncharacterized protein n=1 Tax=Liquidambar formosana TaxID=63359 RepID=A0AAP0S9L7_LIQFO